MLSSIPLAALAWLCVSPIQASASVIRRTDLRSVLTASSNNWAANTTIAFPGSSDFANTTERWTTFDAPSYSAAISPGVTDDVVKAVKLARAHNISFLATGGRHRYGTSLGGLQNGLEIDFGQFNTVEVDTAAETMTIGGATKFADILDPLYKAGFMIQIGSCTCPGMIGVTIGAGVGRYQADGRLIEASKATNSDLFWAIRGAGANFGIITSATHNVHKLQNDGDVTNFDLIFPANMSPSFFKALESFNGTMPEKPLK